MSASRLGTRLMVAAGVVIAATVVAAIVVMGSPGAQREQRMDQRRVRDLGQIQRAVEAYYLEHGALPAGMAVLAARPGIGLSTTDPADGRPYVFRAEGAGAYVLCATFSTDTAEQAEGRRWGGMYYSNDAAWAHGRGDTCFRRRVQPESR